MAAFQWEEVDSQYSFYLQFPDNYGYLTIFSFIYWLLVLYFWELCVHFICQFIDWIIFVVASLDYFCGCFFWLFLYFSHKSYVQCKIPPPFSRLSPHSVSCLLCYAEVLKIYTLSFFPAVVIISWAFRAILGSPCLCPRLEMFSHVIL